MAVKNAMWLAISRVFGAATIFMGAVLIVDAWILGDAGPDWVWWLNFGITMGVLGLGIFTENKADIRYEADESQAV